MLIEWRPVLGLLEAARVTRHDEHPSTGLGLGALQVGAALAANSAARDGARPRSDQGTHRHLAIACRNEGGFTLTAVPRAEAEDLVARVAELEAQVRQEGSLTAPAAAWRPPPPHPVTPIATPTRCRSRPPLTAAGGRRDALRASQHRAAECRGLLPGAARSLACSRSLHAAGRLAVPCGLALRTPPARPAHLALPLDPRPALLPPPIATMLTRIWRRRCSRPRRPTCRISGSSKRRPRRSSGAWPTWRRSLRRSARAGVTPDSRGALVLCVGVGTGAAACEPVLRSVLHGAQQIPSQRLAPAVGSTLPGLAATEGCPDVAGCRSYFGCACRGLALQALSAPQQTPLPPHPNKPTHPCTAAPTGTMPRRGLLRCQTRWRSCRGSSARPGRRPKTQRASAMRRWPQRARRWRSGMLRRQRRRGRRRRRTQRAQRGSAPRPTRRTPWWRRRGVCVCACSGGRSVQGTASQFAACAGFACHCPCIAPWGSPVAPELIPTRPSTLQTRAQARRQFLPQAVAAGAARG